MMRLILFNFLKASQSSANYTLYNELPWKITQIPPLKRNYFSLKDAQTRLRTFLTKTNKNF